MRKIIYLDIHPVPDEIPEALQILQTCDGLAAAGSEVFLVTPRAGMRPDTLLGRAPHPNLKFVWLDKPFVYRYFIKRSSAWFYKKAFAYLNSQAADLVLVRNLKLADFLLRKTQKIPLFFETHEIFSQTYAEDHPNPTVKEARKLEKLLARERYVYEKSFGLLALTKLLAEDVLTSFKIQKPVCVSPDGVNIRQALEFSCPVSRQGKLVALYLGSLHPWKGVETVIQAMANVSDVELHIVGGGNERIRTLSDMADGMGLSEKIKFFGHIAPERRFSVINGADICLLPLEDVSIGSRYTSPLKLFEYMAMGKPIIASDLPSIREVLCHEQDAYLTPPGNGAAWSRSINELAGNADLRRTLGEAAQAKSQSYTWEKRGEGMLSFFESCLNSNQGAGVFSEAGECHD